MRTRILGFGVLAALFVGCGLLPGIGGQQVLGSFVGDGWTGINQAKVRLALVGIGEGGVPIYDNQQEIKNINQFQTYVMELPQAATEAAYRVYAYCDNNTNSRFDTGEDIANSGSKYLLYSNTEGTKTFFFVGTPVANLAVKKGWNGYDSSTPGTAPFQGESYPGYTLTLTGTCS